MAAWIGALAAVLGCDAGEAPSADPVLFARDTPRYQLAVDRAGDAMLRARVEPRGEFHLSTEFPSTLELAAARVRLATQSFARADATALTEERVAFSVPYTGAADGARIEGSFTFGLCEGEELCERITERFDVTLD